VRYGWKCLPWHISHCCCDSVGIFVVWLGVCLLRCGAVGQTDKIQLRPKLQPVGKFGLDRTGLAMLCLIWGGMRVYVCA
jgi:hypothetical protein